MQPAEEEQPPLPLKATPVCSNSSATMASTTLRAGQVQRFEWIFHNRMSPCEDAD
jgi:hypothetical protein